MIHNFKKSLRPCDNMTYLLFIDAWLSVSGCTTTNYYYLL